MRNFCYDHEEDLNTIDECRCGNSKVLIDIDIQRKIQNQPHHVVTLDVR